MEFKKIVLNEERNVTLTAILQDVGGDFNRVKRRPSVLVLPGGGYLSLAECEAEHVALAYVKAGYQAFVLRYSVGRHNTWPNPLCDYEQAMEYIKEHAAEWHLYHNKIAVIGFSAGGHLAGCAATFSKNRPNAAILGYALLDETANLFVPGGIAVPSLRVDEKTCPCFLFAAVDDFLPITNTINFQRALAEKKIIFESHIYAYGGHGFGAGDQAVGFTRLCSRVPNWVNDSIEWLKDIFGSFGSFGTGELNKPKVGSRVIDDLETCLTVDCTLGLLKDHQEELGADGKALMLIEPLLAGIPEPLGSMFRTNLRLRDALLAIAMPEKEIENIDDRLRLIPNKKVANKESK